MSCDRYDRYRSGEGIAGDFARHALGCAECREQAALDERLDKEIVAMRSPVADDGLWERIEASLVREKRSAARRTSFARFWPILVPAGAAVALAVVLGLAVLRRSAVPSGLLAGETLAKVERTEKEYLGAIEALERQARPKMASAMSPEMALYEDRLAAIDAQLDRCREALASNPGNAHIRRYFLAALQDKKRTLADALGSMN